MPTVTLVFDDSTGKLAGLTDKDHKGWGRFLAKIRALGRSCITFEWREPRSGAYHRWAFAQWSTVFGSQERFDDFDEFLCWLKVGAGHCEFLPHPSRGLIAVPKSINFASLDQGEFRAVSDGMFDFLRSAHARETMWPHLSNWDSSEMIQTLLAEFE